MRLTSGRMFQKEHEAGSLKSNTCCLAMETTLTHTKRVENMMLWYPGKLECCF